MTAGATGVVLLSGGLDSGVAAACFCEAGGDLRAALFCDYGQRAAHRERAAATALAARFAVPLHDYALPWLGELMRVSGSRLAAHGGALPAASVARPGDEATAAAVWVPARNAVLVGVAAALAEAIGAQQIVAGFNREEAATFADNSPAFLAAATQMLRYGTRNGVRVTSPTIDWDKDTIVANARRLGFTAADFWSCYDGGAEPCGRCESCVRSRFAR